MTNHEKMSEQLDRIMESVVFEPRMEQAVRQRLHERRAPRRLTRRAVIAMGLCAVLVLSAGAIGLSVVDQMRSHAGSFAPAIQSPAAAVQERDGIEVSVIGAYSDSYGATVYVAVRDTQGKNRLSADSHLSSWNLDAESDTQLSRAGVLDLNNLVSYDDQTQTAIFCLRGSGLQMSGAQPGSQHTYTLTLGTILPKAHELTFTLPQSTASESITQTEIIDQPLDLSLSWTDEPAEVPQAVMSEPVAEGVTLTAAGRLGDDYHVRLALSDCTAGKLNSDISTDSPLAHPDSYVSNIIFDDGHAIDYILHGARIPDASATDDLSFRLTYYTEPVLYGDWTIPVTFTVSEQLPLQIPAGCKLTSAELTAFHVLLTVPEDQTYAYGGTTVSIRYQNGEVITCSGNGWSLTDPAADGQTQYFMEWSTDEPVELAQVASVTVGDFVLTPVQE